MIGHRDSTTAQEAGGGRAERAREGGEQGPGSQQVVSSQDEHVYAVSKGTMEGGAGVAIEEPHEKRKSHRVAALATSGSPQPFIHKKAAAASEQQDDTARQCAMRHILPQSLPLELNIGGQRFTTSLQTLIGEDPPLLLIHVAPQGLSIECSIAFLIS